MKSRRTLTHDYGQKFSPAFIVAVIFTLFWVGDGLGEQASNQPVPQVSVFNIFANGKDLALTPATAVAAAPEKNQPKLFSTYAPVRLAVNRQPLEFLFGPNTNALVEPIRLRYRLEGWDTDWQELGGEMLLVLRYVADDDLGRPIGSRAFKRQGQSEGWSGQINSSHFTPAKLETIVPPRASRLQITWLSGKEPTTGIWAIRHVKLLAANTNGEWKMVLESSTEPGEALDSPQGNPRDWARRGPNMSIPQVLTLNANEKGHALGLVDNDPNSVGGWLAGHRILAAVTPGQKLRLEWEEFYTIGQSGKGKQTYRNLPAGHYTFVVQATDEAGHPTSPECRVSLILTPPFYQAGWFWGVVAGGFALTLVGLARNLTQRRLREQIERARRQQAVTEERMRIAQDLHDDMGARLTQIGLLVPQVLRNGAAGTPAVMPLEKIAKQTRELVLALDQIVWAVNPGQDTLEGLGSYLCHFAAELFAHSDIRFRPNVPALLPQIPLSSPLRNSLFLAVKEALNNVVRHSQATEVTLRLRYESRTRRLEIEIADNGHGFTRDANGQGDGLANMESRLKKFGGTAVMANQPSGGTCVHLALVLPPETVPAAISTSPDTDSEATENPQTGQPD